MKGDEWNEMGMTGRTIEANERNREIMREMVSDFLRFHAGRPRGLLGGYGGRQPRTGEGIVQKSDRNLDRPSAVAESSAISRFEHVAYARLSDAEYTIRGGLSYNYKLHFRGSLSCTVVD